MRSARRKKTARVRQPSSGVRGRVRSWRSLAVLALALVLCAEAASAQGRSGPCAEECLAKALIGKIPEGEKVAMRPFGPPETGIPGPVADDLYDRIMRAMTRVSDRKHEFYSRDLDVWKLAQTERESTDNKEFQKFWEKRKVHVMVRCEDGGVGRNGGIELTCWAFPVGKGGGLGSDVVAPKAVFSIDRPYFPYEYTLAKLGHMLWKDLADDEQREPKDVSLAVIMDTGTGQRSALTEDMEKRVQEAVEERFRSRLEFLQGQANLEAVKEGTGGRTVAPSGSYELRGDLAWMNDHRMRLSVSLQDGGRIVARESDYIDKPWVPEYLLRQDAGAIRYHASARAVPSEEFRVESAKQAARNLARARVVAQALGLAKPKIDDVRSDADGMRLLYRTLGHGIPANESFTGLSEDRDGGWKVNLSARVVKVGSKVRPKFEAKLGQAQLRAMDPIRIELSATEAVRVAVFVWGADNHVVRLYPNRKAPNLSLSAGERLSLPRSGEGKIVSAPLPGHTENHEAVIVIASSQPLDFAKLAPLPGSSLDETMALEDSSGSRFFNKLAELDLSQAALTVLPYRIRSQR